MPPENSVAVALPAAFVDEGLASRWLRRALTVTGYIGLTFLIWLLLPILLPLALASDLARRKRLVATRCVAMLAVYLACETAGILTSGALWLARNTVGIETDRYVALHYALQLRWARTLFRAACRIFSFRLEIEGEDDVGSGPLLVFIRHASLADSLLPANVLTERHGYRLRYVLKRELLWDACLDLVGNRLPNVFVRRGSGDGAREIDATRRLALGVAEHEGVLIYPEGTRFTPAKRERALARLAEGRNPERVERARGMQHVLPPHLGGPLALIETGARCDVLFFSHTGLEGAASIRDIWHGALVGRHIRVRLWRVPRAQIPAGRAERIAWLDAEWSKVDEHVGRSLAMG